MEKKYVYLIKEGKTKLKSLLGSKGANLGEMSNMGLPVPPGLIVTTEACIETSKNGRFPDGLEMQILNNLKIIENETGKKFGDPDTPLLVSVRSGAPISMPGMMDTILNLGLNDITIKGLIAQTQDERFAYDCYRRLIQMFGKVVMKAESDKFEIIIEKHKKQLNVKDDIDLDSKTLEIIVNEFKDLLKREINEFPQDPYQQLTKAVEAVFNSWNSPRAIKYRKIENIPDNLGTGVSIQVMVFGNSGSNSGTGVLFTRNPSTGERNLYGEYLMNAQGEDVVAGIRTPKHIDELKIDAPKSYEELIKICELLENHYKEVQDVEFTIENGQLYILQTRTGKRTGQAAVKIAIDMFEEGLIEKKEAIMRVEPNQLNQLLHRRIDPNAKVKEVGKGLPASPGAASGKVVFNVDETDKRGKEGEKIILVRSETTPEDIHGMVAAQGVLTSRGGKTSHAAVVARAMGKPCVSGCEEIKIDLDNEKFYINDITVNKNDVITIDGSSGFIFLGNVPMIDPDFGPEIKKFLDWADVVKTLKVRTNADTPEDAARGRGFGAEGIGLCRTERMFNAQERLPIVQEMILAMNEEERTKALDKLLPMQKGDFKEIFKIMNELPVTIRLLDLPLHEFLPKLEDLLIDVTTAKITGKNENLEKNVNTLKRVQELSEHNPMLGHRGSRIGIKYPEIYEMQTRAIFEAAVELEKEGLRVGLEIMLPLIGNVNELIFLREKIENIANEIMKREGLKIGFSIGTMIEIPRAALTADQIVMYADFFSFGTNDLTQTVWGYSRDDAEAKFLHDYLSKEILTVNPFEVLDQSGVGKLMNICVELARKNKPDVKIGICGEHGGEPSSVEFCHKIALNYVSCSPFRVPIARLAAAQAEIRDE